MKTRRKFTKEFKQTAVRRLASGQSAAEVARALEVHPSDLQRWRRELQEHGEHAFSGIGRKRAESSELIRQALFLDNFWKPATDFHPTPVGVPRTPASKEPRRRRDCI